VRTKNTTHKYTVWVTITN